MGEIISLLWALGFVFIIPLVFALLFSGQWKKPKTYLWSLAAIGVLLVYITSGEIALNIIFHFFPETPESDDYVWISGFVSIVVTLIVFSLLPKETRQEAGILALPKSDDWKSVVIVCAVLLVITGGVAYLQPYYSDASASTYVYKIVIPSLNEEFVFRGIILAVLIAAFDKPYALAGIRVGWGALPIIAFFVVGHGDFNINLESYAAFYMSVSEFFSSVLLMGVTSAGLIWVKEKTASIWLCVVMHGLIFLTFDGVSRLAGTDAIIF